VPTVDDSLITAALDALAVEDDRELRGGGQKAIRLVRPVKYDARDRAHGEGPAKYFDHRCASNSASDRLADPRWLAIGHEGLRNPGGTTMM
jgi:hypothetical protein